MTKKYFLLFLLVTIFCSAPHFCFSATLKVPIGERSLYVNSVAVKGDWNFTYSIKQQESIGDCDFTKGPMLSYSTTFINGQIFVPSVHKFLENALKKQLKFQVEYRDVKEGKPEEVLFDGCRVVSVCKTKKENGKDCYCYSFRAESALRK